MEASWAALFRTLLLQFPQETTILLQSRRRFGKIYRILKRNGTGELLVDKDNQPTQEDPKKNDLDPQEGASKNTQTAETAAADTNSKSTDESEQESAQTDSKQSEDTDETDASESTPSTGNGGSDGPQNPTPPNQPAGKPKMSTGRRIIIGVVSILVVLVVVSGLGFYHYFKSAQKPLNPNSNKVVPVDIPMGASNKKIGSILQDKDIVKSGMVFNYFVKAHNFTSFRAGYYQLKSSMTLTQIAKQLEKGGSSEPIQSSKGKVLIREGVQIKDIATTIAASTDFSKSEFLSLMKDQTFMKQLYREYPQLLKSTMSAKKVRYRLEGYLYPATYTVNKKMSLKQLVEQMVAATNTELKPYYKYIAKKKMTVQEVLTLASLVEREGVTNTDRRKIAGVFFNRIKQGMPLQSDISVMYAINKHKKNLSNSDLQSNSPYNLYKYAGYGPGPFNSPSFDSIKAVLKPLDESKGYLYFVANMKTGKIYYSKTLAEHNEKSASLSSANK